jgi:hypothetical protein
MKRICILLITIVLLTGIVGCGGTPSQDLEIYDWYDLDAIRDNLNRNYILMNNLDSATSGYDELASPTANEGKGWEPIGTWTPESSWTGFMGTFDGQGYEIRDLLVNHPGTTGVGLFGFIDDGGVIQNLGMANATVTGYSYVGSMIGLSFGTVSNSYSAGSVTGGEWVGGLVGWNDMECTVTNSYSTSYVNGHFTVGGLVGYNHLGTVNNSYSTGNVIGGEWVGGLVGCHITGNVTNSYSTGSVVGNSSVGGLVGYNLNDATVSNSYSTGNVAGNSSVGGLVGRNYEGSVSHSFWDTETSGQATSAGGVGKNTTEMQDIITFSGATWSIVAVANHSTPNLSYIWNIVDDETYPFLSWEPVS